MAVMASVQLIAPRPVRIGGGAVHLPFFLRNALAVRSPGSPCMAVRPSPLLVEPPSAGPLAPTTSSLASQESNVGIDELTARMSLVDEPPRRASAPSPLLGREWRAGSPSWTFDTPLSPSKSPEAAAVLDEFLSILRPAIMKTPSSPITRSKRLIPRSRHTVLASLSPPAPGPERHHPYARVKSSSPLASETGESFAATRKRSSSRSSAKALARRRSSTLLSSNSSNSSHSVSRRGSDGSLNYVQTSSPPLAVPMEPVEPFGVTSHVEAASLLLSGMPPLSSNPETSQ